MIRRGVFQGSAERVGDLDQGSSAELSVFRDLHDVPLLKYKDLNPGLEGLVCWLLDLVD